MSRRNGWWESVEACAFSGDGRAVIHAAARPLFTRFDECPQSDSHELDFRLSVAPSQIGAAIPRYPVNARHDYTYRPVAMGLHKAGKEVAL